MEPALFATSETNRIRSEIAQAFQSSPPNLSQLTKSQSLVIVLVIQALKTNFGWICNSGPGKSAQTCSNWQLLIG